MLTNKPKNYMSLIRKCFIRRQWSTVEKVKKVLNWISDV